MRAPIANGDTTLKQIVASGGVVVTALGPTGLPDGRKLTADNVVWKAKTGSRADQLIARGHVVYTDQTSGMTIRCPEMITDSHFTHMSASNGTSDMSGAILKRKK
jgi:lipopolysaccharide assembly outer membrane protein LptD (OstA)